jgi:hypothetical protein
MKLEGTQEAMTMSKLLRDRHLLCNAILGTQLSTKALERFVNLWGSFSPVNAMR